MRIQGAQRNRTPALAASGVARASRQSFDGITVAAGSVSLLAVDQGRGFFQRGAGMPAAQLPAGTFQYSRAGPLGMSNRLLCALVRNAVTSSGDRGL